jgi:hypothetical protein
VSKEKSPAFQFYPKDLLSDINWIYMTYPERGMYWQLISICWLEGSLPADEGALARLLQVRTEDLLEAWKVIGKCFKSNVKGGSRLVHPRLELERKKQAAWREKSAMGGRHSAHKRKIRKAKTLEQGGYDMVPTNRQPKANTPSPSPIASAGKPPTVPQGDNGTELRDLFAMLWSWWPRKEAKQEAWLEFQKLQPTRETVMLWKPWIDSAKRSEQWQDKSKIPHLRKQLFRRRFEDDPPPPTHPGKLSTSRPDIHEKNLGVADRFMQRHADDDEKIPEAPNEFI